MPDQWIARRPRPRCPIAAATTFRGYRPQDLWSIYNFPQEFDGSGSVIALLEFGSGYAQSDIDAFCRETGLPPAKITGYSVDGGQNDGGGQPGDLEATLDIQVAHGGAPGAEILFVEGMNAQDYPSFAQAVLGSLAALLSYPRHIDVVSISYGDAEEMFPTNLMEQAESLIAQLTAKGTLVFVSSGDQGAYGSHVPGLPLVRRADWPATCPSAIAVGGTTLNPGSKGTPYYEVVWQPVNYDTGASGGGYSSVFARPSYQDRLQPQNPQRGEPDLSALADPATGYFVICEGQPQIIGGTSASAPLVAALFARIAQARREHGLPPLTGIHADLYAHPECFRDITWGINSYWNVVGYNAGPGWDAATGMGAPDGMALLNLFCPGAAAKPSPPKKPKFEIGVVKAGKAWRVQVGQYGTKEQAMKQAEFVADMARKAGYEPVIMGG